MVASRTAGSWPSHRNLSNSVFLRVLFWKRAARFVIIRGLVSGGVWWFVVVVCCCCCV